jgi:hypothetical protein
MKRKFFAICSVLIAAILLVALVPGCDGEPTEEATIEVEAIYLCDGQPWEGLVNYTLTSSANVTVSGSSVPDSQTVAPGTWTLNISAGGPPNSFVHNITPLAIQTVAVDGTITFTVEFDRGLDAEISFVTWTINGEPAEGNWAPLGPFHYVSAGDVIDIEYQQRVRGCDGVNVTVQESSYLYIYHMSDWQTFPLMGRLHVANNACAVEKVPTYAEGARVEKFSQYPGVWMYYDIWSCLAWNFSSDWLNPWYMPAPLTFNYTFGDPSLILNEATTYGLETGPLYDKSINWLTFGFYDYVPEDCTLFQLVVDQPWATIFCFLTGATVELIGEEDVNPANNQALGPPNYDPPLCVVVLPPA